MKTKTLIIAIVSTIIITSCKKKEESISTVTPTNTGNSYSSLQDFYNQNGVQMQFYTVDASAGGMFVTPKGTTVTIPANAFTTQLGGPVSGIVTIEFKDIYGKNDMLLSNVTSIGTDGKPMVSAGEFFIKATSSGSDLLMSSGQMITVEQPNPSGVVDTAMTAFIGVADSAAGVAWWPAWFPILTGAVSSTASEYIFTMYNYSASTNGGTWCNSDNSSYFSAYAQTSLELAPTIDPDEYSVDVFVSFTGINSMVHVYRSSATNFDYAYAPVGLPATVIAIGVKNGKLYSSFTPVTITGGLTTNFSLTETTDAAFKAQLNALN